MLQLSVVVNALLLTDRQYTCGVSEDNDQFVDTNVGRGRRTSINMKISTERRIPIDIRISIDTKDVMDWIHRYS